MHPDVAAVGKAELHCHIDGLIDRAMLVRLVAEGHDLGIDPDVLAPVGSFAEWGRYNQLIEPAFASTEDTLTLCAEQHVRRLRAQGCCYAELFVSRLLGAFSDDGALVEAFRRLRARLEAAAGGTLAIELVVTVARKNAERLAAQTPRILALHRAGLIGGFALAGDEARIPVAALRASLDRLRGAGLGIEIHAGETQPAASVWDAVENGSPHRIGHGISAFADPRLLDLIGERGIHVEICPTSNLRLGVVRAYRDLPVVEALRRGLSFSINTDDPGPFGCSLTSELEVVRSTFGLDDAQLASVCESTVRAGFARHRA